MPNYYGIPTGLFGQILGASGGGYGVAGTQLDPAALQQQFGAASANGFPGVLGAGTAQQQWMPPVPTDFTQQLLGILGQATLSPSPAVREPAKPAVEPRNPEEEVRRLTEPPRRRLAV